MDWFNDNDQIVENEGITNSIDQRNKDIDENDSDTNAQPVNPKFQGGCPISNLMLFLQLHLTKKIMDQWEQVKKMASMI